MTKFGYTLMTEQSGPKDLVRYAISAEERGFDFEVCSDHFSPWLASQGHAPNAWAVLGAVAQATERVNLYSYVTCPTMRYHPAIVAQQAATVQILADGRKTGEIQACNHDLEPAGAFAVDRAVSDASVDEFDGLVLPGGTVNPDKLRLNESAVSFVRDFVDSGKPVAAICHSPWTLVEAGVTAGRTLTSYPSIRTDLRNAGAHVVDEEVVVDGNLISSRSPSDLPAFCSTIVKQFAHAAPN